jgi:hypothetical protein
MFQGMLGTDALRTNADLDGSHRKVTPLDRVAQARTVLFNFTRRREFGKHVMSARPPVGRTSERDGFRADSPDEASFASVLRGIAALPEVLQLLEDQATEIRELKDEIHALKFARFQTDDGWLNTKEAAAYVDMSPNTFEKYRSDRACPIKGYRVGGKMLFKRKDLDNFVRLWEAKSDGFA